MRYRPMGYGGGRVVKRLEMLNLQLVVITGDYGVQKVIAIVTVE